MKTNRYLCTAAGLLLLASAGCSVLTKSQVQEVNKFAVAAKNYGDMPGTVIAEHARIRKIRQVVAASTYFNGATALEAIQVALDQQRNLDERGRRTDAALQVLKDYADLLVKLTSDEFTGDLQASAETLGKSIDGGINRYNAAADEKLSMFGSGVAAVVRGIGGFHIRRAQEKALKSAISSADPVVRALTWTVEETMALYLDGDQMDQIEDLSLEDEQSPLSPGGLLSREKKEVMDKYKSTAGLFEGKQPLCLAMTVTNEMDDCDDAVVLATDTLKAAASFRKAHAKLAAVIQKTSDLPEVIEEVQVLVDEVKSAQALKEKLDNK